MVKLDFLFKPALFGHILAHSLFGAWTFFLVHIQFTPIEKTQKLCKLIFLKNQTIQVGPSGRTMKNAIFHGPTPRSTV
jgi:hypothetical protein